MSVMLASKVKDAEIWLSRFLRQVEKLEDVSRVVIEYGESKDKTFAILSHWRDLSRHNVEIYKEPFLPIEERHGYTLTRVKQDIQRLLKEGGEKYYLNPNKYKYSIKDLK